MSLSKAPWIISSPERTVRSGVIELWNYRAILFALIKRDLKSRYRTSFMGFAWAFAKPLMQFTVYSVVLGEILGASRSIDNFAIFIFTGLMFWGFFAESINVGTSSVVAGAGLVTKVSFPREILPLATVVIAAINLMLQFPILLIGYFLTGARPSISGIGFITPLLISLFLISLSFALILSAVNVYARDTQPLVEMLTLLLMFLSPVMYSWTFVADRLSQTSSGIDWFEIYRNNPLTQIIVGVQDYFWGGKRIYADATNAPLFLGSSMVHLWLVAIASFIFLGLAYKFFIKLESNFAREL